MFRTIGSVFQIVVISMTMGTVCILSVILFGGFIVPKCKISKNCSSIYLNVSKPTICLTISCFLPAASMPSWLEWGFWVSPLTYGEIGLTVNEFRAPRWEKVVLNCSHQFDLGLIDLKRNFLPHKFLPEL